MTSTYTEYGVRYANGDYLWPDGDGDLALGFDYLAASDAPHGDHGGAEIDVAAIRRKLPEGAVLVTRTWSSSEPETAKAPLPTAPGSIVFARPAAYAPSRLLVRMDTSARDHWRELTAAGIAGFFTDGQLSDVEVRYDAGAGK